MNPFHLISTRRTAQKNAAREAAEDVYTAVLDARMDGRDVARVLDPATSDYARSGAMLARGYSVPVRWRDVWARTYARVSASESALYLRGLS